MLYVQKKQGKAYQRGGDKGRFSRSKFGLLAHEDKLARRATMSRNRQKGPEFRTLRNI